jgi:hypothetical protein
MRQIFKRFKGIASEGDILQCFEREEDVNKDIDEVERCIVAASLPLYEHKEDILYIT